MADENCNVCGSPLSSLGGEGTALAQHILDHSDPHHTLALVSSIELGLGEPASAEGRKRKDLYIDLAAQRVYVVVGGADGLEWAAASAAPGVSQAGLAAALSGYVSSSALSTALAGYVRSSEMSAYARASDLAAYATVAAVQTALEGYVRLDGLSELGLVSGSGLAAALSGCVTRASLETLLAASYLTSADAASTYATKGELAGYVPLSGVPAITAGHVFRSPTSPGVYPELDLDVVLRDYLTSAAAAAAYVTPAWLRTNGYVTSAALESALAPYATAAALSSAVSGCLTQAAADARYVLASGYDPPQLPTGIMGAVFRSPTSPGVYPERNLDVVLQGYLTVSAAASTYVTQTSLAGLGYVTSSGLAAALAGYVTQTALDGALAQYLTKSDAVATYVTPQYLADNGYLRASDSNRFVYRQEAGATLDLDSVLNSWPAQSVGQLETKPPSGSAVYAALAQRDSAIAALQSQVNNLSVTGGQSAVINVIEEPEGLQSNTGLIPVDDKAVNTIVMSGDWLSRVSSNLTVAVPDAYQNSNVARDFLVVLYFPSSAGTGQVPVTFSGFVTRAGGAVSLFSYTSSGLFSLTGIAYGMMVVYALTEMRPGVFAVTRKNLYEV